MATAGLRSEIYMAGIKVARIAYSPRPDNLALVDKREWPVYSLAEVAYFLEIPKPTLHSWTRAKVDSKGITQEPLIVPADRTEALFSFYNLIESHILSVTTKTHKVKVSAVRSAMQELLATGMATGNHPLLSREFHTDGKDIFVKLIENTVNLSRRGQYALKPIMDEYLLRIERDDAFKPKKLYPAKQQNKIVAMIPTVSSGRPVIDGTGIPVASIWNRYRAGDSVEFIADDYDIAETQVEGAISYIEQLKAA
jgi:uncharacterized protein (DUF433 family)